LGGGDLRREDRSATDGYKMVTEWLQTRASSRCGTVYFVFGFGSGVLARLILDVGVPVDA